MRYLCNPRVLALGVLMFASLRTDLRAQNVPPENIFHVKYIADGSVYLDAGGNAGLEEGMILHVVHADPKGGTTESIRFRKEAPVADLRIFSVASSSSAF